MGVASTHHPRILPESAPWGSRHVRGKPRVTPPRRTDIVYLFLPEHSGRRAHAKEETMPTFTHDASVKHFRHESKALLKALEAGSAEAASRISRSLPRLADASVEDVLAAGVGLQEIQHVIAREQGCSQWRDLVDDDAPRFESITELSDADIRVLLREVGPRDMALALQGLVDGPMSKRHQAMFGMLQQLSETVHDELRSQVKSMELDVIAIAEAQSRIAQQARTLEVKGMIGKAAAQPENDARLPAPNLPASTSGTGRCTDFLSRRSAQACARWPGHMKRACSRRPSRRGQLELCGTACA